MAKLEDVTVDVLSLQDGNTAEDLREWLPISPQIFPTSGPAMFRYAPKLWRCLQEIDSDIVRVDGLWTYPSIACLNWHRAKKRPYIVAPRGMLDPWALNNSRSKKRMAGWLFEHRHLRKAACIHALCDAEANSIRDYGLNNPIAIIPNGIDLPETRKQESEVRSQNFDRQPPAPGCKKLLYLGRIHPKKGLVNLLRAWAAVRKADGGKWVAEEWILAIAGWDQGRHLEELRMLSVECGVQDSVRFLGPKFGEAKAACYRECDAFILPSLSEGMPMVVLEAWAYGKPVLMTPECNLPEGFMANAAIRIEASAESIAEGLQELFCTPHSLLHAMGNNGRTLAASRFAWPKIAIEMKSVYEWMLGGGPKPDCVILSR